MLSIWDSSELLGIGALKALYKQHGRGQVNANT